MKRTASLTIKIEHDDETDTTTWHWAMDEPLPQGEPSTWPRERVALAVMAAGMLRAQKTMIGSMRSVAAGDCDDGEDCTEATP